MTIDLEHHLGEVQRKVTPLKRDGKPARAVTLTRNYDTTIDDLWDALTNKERLSRWFLPVEGDLKPNGRYQLKGNASGTITTCEPPTDLALTWEFGDDLSWVEIRLEEKTPEQIHFSLTHTAHISEHWQKYGPGAVGIGWELGILGLALHLSSPDAKFDETEFSTSSDGKAYIIASSTGWADADIASGAVEENARAAEKNTTAFYTGEAVPED